MIADEGLIDVLSLNENEARIITKRLGLRRLPFHYRAHDVLVASSELHDELKVTVDIHTPLGSASASDGEHGWEPSVAYVHGFVTGAGDVWNAGDIVGHLMNFSIRERLRFANANAYLYLASRKARFAGLKEVMYFMRGRNRPR
jgi:sugar/nucleoside kinase (ribokinase family)